jgi:hypothetical protein
LVNSAPVLAKPRSRVLRESLKPPNWLGAAVACLESSSPHAPLFATDHSTTSSGYAPKVYDNMKFLEDVAEQSRNVVRLPAMYNEFITKNAGAVGQVEGALRSLTYLIPGRPPSR